MADPLPEAAAHEGAKTDTRSAAKWLIASFAGVGGALLTGVGLNSIGQLEDGRLLLALGVFAVGAVVVIIAVSLVTDVLTPAPVTLADLADFEKQRNCDGADPARDELVRYIEHDPALLQGMVPPGTPPQTVLMVANRFYVEALDDRFLTTEAYLAEARDKRSADRRVVAAKRRAEAADVKVEAMHTTVRRLEQVTAAQQTVFNFRARRGSLAICALLVAGSIGGVAAISNPPEPPAADLRGADLTKVDLSGASLRGADLEGMTIEGADLFGTNLEGAKTDGTVWKRTVCPDGTDSDNAGGTCDGHLAPRYKPGP